MTTQPTVTDVRRGLVETADDHHERTKPYSRKRDVASFDAWCGHMTAANFANVIAAMLRRAAEDHGEEYAARLAEIVTAAEDDGEDAYFANDDVRLPVPTVRRSVSLGPAPAASNDQATDGGESA